MDIDYETKLILTPLVSTYLCIVYKTCEHVLVVKIFGSKVSEMPSN